MEHTDADVSSSMLMVRWVGVNGTQMFGMACRWTAPSRKDPIAFNIIIILDCARKLAIIFYLFFLGKSLVDSDILLY